MGILTDLLDPVVRAGRGVASGIGAAGRDVWGQMSGSTGPTNSRWQNIGINAANPFGMMQTGQAFSDGFRDGYGGSQPSNGMFDRSRAEISRRAGSGSPGVGSVVGRGFVGDGRGNAAVQRVPSQRPQTDVFGGTPGQPSQRDPWQMPGTNPSVGLMGSSALARAQTNAAMSGIANQTRGTQGAGSTEEWLGGGDDRQVGSTRLGAGQLGTMGEQTIQNGMNAFMSRGGTSQER